MAPRLRICAFCATGVVAFTVWICSPALAATITPNTVQDVVVNNDGKCSLREAITASFTHNPSGAKPGECPAGTGGDIVDVGSGHYVLTGAPNDDLNVSGDLDIRSSLTIKGAGPGTATIDANHVDRVLDVKASQTVTIQGVTITGGLTPVGGAGANSSTTTDIPGDGTPGQPGGGILNAGTLTILNSVVTGNTTGAGGQGGSQSVPSGASPGNIAGGGNGGNGGAGGGVSTSGPLTVDHSTISSNKTGAGGRAGPAFGGSGAAGSGAGAGAEGGVGFGGVGGKGGAGGGIDAPAALTVVDSAISNNATGDGGLGALGVGGNGGTGGGTGAGGKGADGIGGRGGDGGLGGGLEAQNGLTMRRSLVNGNTTGAGGVGGPGNGGTGGLGQGGANGGTGGDGDGGRGGPGGTTAGAAAFGASTIVNTTVTANVAGPGGTGANGVAGSGGNPTLVAGNAKPGRGGDGGSGVGVIDNPQVNLIHDTITSNKVGSGGAPGDPVQATMGGPTTPATPGATGQAGGLFGIGTLTLQNSIVAFNTGGNCGGAVTDGGHNLSFGDATCPGTNADPQLGPLAGNGGPTATQAIPASSPAHDAVPASGAGCESTDQRGVGRPQGPACDIGAFELGAGPGGTPLDTTPPVFQSASMAPTVFAVNRGAGGEVAVTARKKPKRGTTFRYTLSEAARVVFTIQKPAAGRKVGKTCRKPSRSNRRKRRCTRFVRVGRFAVTSVAGANSHRFSGKIGSRALKPGSYRVLLVATDAAGNHSRQKTLKFRVVSG